MTDQSKFTQFDKETPTDRRTITVAHVSEDYDLYGGRATHGRCLGEAEPPQSGWLGNPHTLSNHSREEAIDLYRDDFIRQLAQSWRFVNACVALPGTTVACHCRRSDEDEPGCHLDVVRELLLDGTVFGFAKHAHDISMAEWKKSEACSPEELL